MNKKLSLFLLVSLAVNLYAADPYDNDSVMVHHSDIIQIGNVELPDGVFAMVEQLEVIGLNPQAPQLVKNFLDSNVSVESLNKILAGLSEQEVNQQQLGFSLGHYAAWCLLKRGSFAGIVALVKDGRFVYDVKAENAKLNHAPCKCIRDLLEGHNLGYSDEYKFTGNDGQELRWLANFALETLLANAKTKDLRDIRIQALQGDLEAKIEVAKQYRKSIAS